jgi:ectoine hydroxylase-related dioxygenase (phytanoyl-CoA dioxygenase family)
MGEELLYRSRFGGLWTDRCDAHDLLEARRAAKAYSDADVALLAHYIDHGYVILENATDGMVIDDYLAHFEAAWDDPPERLWLQWNQQGLPMDRKFYDEVAKVGSLHLSFDRAGELLYPPRVLRFLTQIYERPPVAFQTLTMRKGSEESLHIDTAPLTLTEPMSLVGSWVALEDVQPGSGEFQYVPGSHGVPEHLHHGTYKGHNGDHRAAGEVIMAKRCLCDERGLDVQTFMAKKGDVLIWHGDLLHGAVSIEDSTKTRKSLIAHLMPLGVMPTFFDFSRAGVIAYPGGGYTIDVPWSDMLSGPAPTNEASASSDWRVLDLWRDWVPLSLRKRVPPFFSAQVRKHIHS